MRLGGGCYKKGRIWRAVACWTGWWVSLNPDSCILLEQFVCEGSGRVLELHLLILSPRVICIAMVKGVVLGVAMVAGLLVGGVEGSLLARAAVMGKGSERNAESPEFCVGFIFSPLLFCGSSTFRGERVAGVSWRMFTLTRKTP
jgi:hypothetical protein